MRNKYKVDFDSYKRREELDKLITKTRMKIIGCLIEMSETDDLSDLSPDAMSKSYIMNMKVKEKKKTIKSEQHRMGFIISNDYSSSSLSSHKGHSYIIGLGNYTGGELVFHDKKSPYYGTHNIKNRWLKQLS